MPLKNDLFLECIRLVSLSASGKQIRSFLPSPLDWTFLFQRAQENGLIPLFYTGLKNIWNDSIPPEIMGQMRSLFLKNARRNILLTQELFRVLDVFEAERIQAIPFKGPVLAAVAYENLALREFGDLDFLVPKKDIFKAKKVLLANGFLSKSYIDTKQKPPFPPSFWQFPFFCGAENFCHRDRKTMVDLHWKLTPAPFPFSFEGRPFWKRLVKVSLEGRNVLTFSAEDMLITLCLHGAVHYWERLNSICDVAQLIRAYPGMDWDRVMGQADVLGGKRILFLGLILARNYFETILPEEIFKKVQADSSVQSLAGQIGERLLRDGDPPRGTLQQSFFYLQMSERWQSKFTYCLRLAMAPTVGDWVALPLPQSLFFLYYIFHPLRVLGKYIGPALKYLFRRNSSS